MWFTCIVSAPSPLLDRLQLVSAHASVGSSADVCTEHTCLVGSGRSSVAVGWSRPEQRSGWRRARASVPTISMDITCCTNTAHANTEMAYQFFSSTYICNIYISSTCPCQFQAVSITCAFNGAKDVSMFCSSTKDIMERPGRDARYATHSQ